MVWITRGTRISFSRRMGYNRKTTQPARNGFYRRAATCGLPPELEPHRHLQPHPYPFARRTTRLRPVTRLFLCIKSYLTNGQLQRPLIPYVCKLLLPPVCAGGCLKEFKAQWFASIQISPVAQPIHNDLQMLYGTARRNVTFRSYYGK